MPIIQIQSLPQKPSIIRDNAIRKLCTEVSKQCGIPEKNVWATWEIMEPRNYTEGDQLADEQPEQTHPPIVNVIVFEGATQEKIEKMLKSIADTLCKELKLAEGNVFIRYTQVKSGMIYSGGEIVYKQ
ncbi:MAG: hypothetical protein HY606_00360 [Planctomycetes bacterium]|nr:hypothetical protein [Planctomycetota bacterium]